MHNIAPTTIASLPAATETLAELEHAFNARRRQLRAETEAAILTGRILAQPSMEGTAGPRSQPRDGRGRFLTKAWLAAAETFTAADLAWFRSPIEGK